MQLIADSGSTKTTWALIDKGSVKVRVNTAGLNPYFHSSESIEAVLTSELLPYLVPDHVREIHFYGSGCSTENNKTMIADALQIFFRKAVPVIYHDILGAARALFGKDEGIAGILGTGSNSCYYDGGNCYSKVDSLGYLFGDEGAGSYLGKQLIGKYLTRQLPDDIRASFDEKYNFTLEDILNSLYNRPYPNRFLASFSEFLSPNQDHPFVHGLVKEAFQAFFNAQIKQYENYKLVTVSFVGSIAYNYREILLETAREEGINVGTILSAPIEGLIRFHSSII